VVGETNIIPDKFTTDYESVIVFGKAYELTGEEKEEALLSILYKYSPEFLEKGRLYIKNAADKTTVIKIDIRHMTGKARG
jgi:nitroimidazol reductase NimA-like FMN-containing flavoprotein (pyridoxamine 5'-phosphate oxidase superfamily)